jgi:hypothetical protein
VRNVKIGEVWRVSSFARARDDALRVRVRSVITERR